jgi:UTP--glucose-1-phosphate uridylyltransferase
VWALAKINKCVIPAAGIGSRFYPLTRAQPKEMLPVLDRPVIHYVVEEAIKSGLDEVLIIIGSGKDSIINYFDKHPLDDKEENSGVIDFPDIYFIRQKSPLGLADSIKYARDFTSNEPFVVLLGDTIYRSLVKRTVTQQLLEVYKKYNSTCLSLESVPKEKVRDYGMVKAEKVTNDIVRIKGVVEKPEPDQTPSNLGVTGIYAFQPEIYDFISRIKSGKNGEYQLSDAIDLMCKEMEVYGHIINGKRYDIGTMELWVKTFIEFAKSDKRFR